MFRRFMGRLVVVCFLSAAAASQSVSASQSQAGTEVATSSVMQLQGTWDLLWKEEKGASRRVHCRMHQVGALITLHVVGPSPANIDDRTPIEGSVQTRSLTFRVHWKDGRSVIFNGEMDNGILHGTTSSGFTWMAIKNPEERR